MITIPIILILYKHSLTLKKAFVKDPLFFIQLGYYQYDRVLISLAGVSIIHVLGGAAGGMLLLNWMQKSPLSKILLVVSCSCLPSLSEYVYRILGALETAFDR
jgi:hypothetical protein